MKALAALAASILLASPALATVVPEPSMGTLTLVGGAVVGGVLYVRSRLGR